MIENIDKIFERGDRLDTLVVKTDDLATDAYRFQKGTKKLQWKVILTVVALVFILLAVIVFCLFVCTTTFYLV